MVAVVVMVVVVMIICENLLMRVRENMETVLILSGASNRIVMDYF